MIIDDLFSAHSSGWTERANVNVPKFGSTYLTSNSVPDLAVFYPATTLVPGVYEVRVFFAAGSARTTAAPHDVTDANGVTRVLVNQTVQPSLSSFLSLGTFVFSGNLNLMGVTVKSETGLNVAADAVMFVCVG